MEKQYRDDFKLERNQQVLKDYLNRMSLKDIQERYSISRQRIYQIIKRMGNESIRYNKEVK